MGQVGCKSEKKAEKLQEIIISCVKKDLQMMYEEGLLFNEQNSDEEV